MDELAKLLAVAAEKLGFEAARIWPQVVLITFTKNVSWLVLDVLTWITGITVLVRWWHWALIEIDKYKQDKDTDAFITFSAIGSLIIVMVLIATLVTAPDHIAGVVAPEAKTVIDLLNKK